MQLDVSGRKERFIIADYQIARMEDKFAAWLVGRSFHLHLRPFTRGAAQFLELLLGAIDLDRPPFRFQLIADAAQFAQALDPAHFVAVRAGVGGVAPAATAAVLDTLATGLEADQQGMAAQRAQQEAAAADRKSTRLNSSH